MGFCTCNQHKRLFDGLIGFVAQGARSKKIEENLRFTRLSNHGSRALSGPPIFHRSATLLISLEISFICLAAQDQQKVMNHGFELVC